MWNVFRHYCGNACTTPSYLIWKCPIFSYKICQLDSLCLANVDIGENEQSVSELCFPKFDVKTYSISSLFRILFPQCVDIHSHCQCVMGIILNSSPNPPKIDLLSPHQSRGLLVAPNSVVHGAQSSTACLLLFCMGLSTSCFLLCE